MKFTELPLTGAYLIELEPFMDDRGSFSRTFCQREFKKIGFHKQIVQINHSVTKQKGTIRGMHYQNPPHCESKIIRCIKGKIFDVIVDIRANSPSFKQWYGLELSKDNLRMIYVPEGFAHGFQSVTDNIELIYFSSAFYSPEHEQGLRYDDPAISIKLPLPMNAISFKDISYPYISINFAGINIINES